MKKTAVFLFLTVSTASFAQNYPGMNEADMQKMMQQVEKMQSCMEQVDENALKALEERSRQIEQEVKALCASGEREQAEQLAMSYAEEIAASPTMKQINKCDAMMDSMMATMAYKAKEQSGNDRHVCD